MHLEPFIRDLAVILTVAGAVSLVFQKIRQPVVLGYIIAGIIVGPYTPPYALVSDTAGIRIWAELGLIFLMFSLGLEFSFRKLASVGLPAGLTACFEIAFMLMLGFISGRLLGWSGMDSLFLGAMLSISSTTIIIKALDELKLKNRRFAEMIFAILIVEDLVAILILVALSSIAVNHSASAMVLFDAASKLTLVVGSWFITGYFLVPRLIRYIGRTGNDEMLTIVSLGLCLALVVFSSFFEYSVALGAFIMGSILAETVESKRIEERMSSLRDVFASVFFVSVGMLIDPVAIWQNKGPIVLLTLVTILGKVFSTTAGALCTGQTLKTSVQVGFGVAQIGEFSFIIAGLGMTLGVTSPFLYPVGVAVSLLTTFTTPYMIRVSHRFARQLEDRLPAKIKAVFSQYVSWTLKQQADVARKKEILQNIFKWLVNALIVSVLFILSGEFLLPFIEELIPNSILSSGLGWLLTVSISTPFIWAMLSTFHKPDASSKRKFFSTAPFHGITFIFQFVSVLWVGTLSLEFFQAKNVVLLVGSLTFGLFALFYKQIETSYQWFETRFISTFDPKEKQDHLGGPSASHSEDTEPFQRLAPWDAHLVRFKVHPNASLVGTRIIDAQLRTRFGVSIVAIQRGLKTLVAPRPEEFILPNDELLALGTDEQLEAIRVEMERPLGLREDRLKTIQGYDLRQVIVGKNSPMTQVSIRASRIRENFGALVVGLERADSRIINPKSDLDVHVGDTLWVVGEKPSLDRLAKWNFGPVAESTE